MRGYQSLPPAVEACGERSLCVCVGVGVVWVCAWVCGCACVGVGELVAGALLSDMAVSDNTAKLRSCG